MKLFATSPTRTLLLSVGFLFYILTGFRKDNPAASHKFTDYTFNYECGHSYVFTMVLTNTATGVVYTFHLNPVQTPTFAGSVPQGIYNMTLTDNSNTATTNFTVITCNGPTQQSGQNFSANNLPLNCSTAGMIYLF